MQEDKYGSQPVALEQRTHSSDQRMFSPSAARNSAPLLEVFKRLIPPHSVVLEVGCGTGEHAVCFAEGMPSLTWTPSDPDPASRASTASWITFKGLKNVSEPVDIDASSDVWGVETLAPFDVVSDGSALETNRVT